MQLWNNFIIEELLHNVKTKRALRSSLGYSMHAKISARIIYRFESWNRTCCDACNHTPYCPSISLTVHWKHCNLLLPLELKYEVQPTTNLHQAKQQWTFTSLQWIMLNYEMQWPKLNVVMHKAMNYIRCFLTRVMKCFKIDELHANGDGGKGLVNNNFKCEIYNVKKKTYDHKMWWGSPKWPTIALNALLRNVSTIH